MSEMVQDPAYLNGKAVGRKNERRHIIAKIEESKDICEECKSKLKAILISRD